MIGHVRVSLAINKGGEDHALHFYECCGVAGVVERRRRRGADLEDVKSLDAPHYDGQRTTWSPSSDIST